MYPGLHGVQPYWQEPNANPQLQASYVQTLPSSVYVLLYFRIDANHPSIEVRVILHQDVRVPRHGHKDRVHAATYWRHEDLTDLQSDQKAKG